MKFALNGKFHFTFHVSGKFHDPQNHFISHSGISLKKYYRRRAHSSAGAALNIDVIAQLGRYVQSRLQIRKQIQYEIIKIAESAKILHLGLSNEDFSYVAPPH